MFCCGSSKKTNPGDVSDTTALMGVKLLIMRLFNQCLLGEQDAAIRSIPDTHIEICMCRRANVTYTVLYDDAVFVNLCKQCINVMIDIFTSESAKVASAAVRIPLLVHADV